jgi:allophanate hydrolase subunit 2
MNNWKEDGGFHLTVDRDGRVSLWDCKEVAQEIFGETYVFFAISPEEEHQLEDAAAKIAEETSQEGNGF